MVFHWSLSNGKPPLVSRIFLSILADHSNDVLWMLATCLLISKSSSSFTNHLGFVPCAPAIISISVTFMIHCLFSSLARTWYPSLFPLSFNFTLDFLSNVSFFLCCHFHSPVLHGFVDELFDFVGYVVHFQTFYYEALLSLLLLSLLLLLLLLVVVVVVVEVVVVVVVVFIPWEFFTLAASFFFLKFEWKLISSSLQDSSQYSGRS